ncbi:MAG: hypothetical protein HY344_02995 [Candidatus Levybacteria bacterium]|nr:hypothetical protein [Candidatus Levybacteria bacterium]
MSEKENMPIENQSELTTQPVNSTLKTGDIFMEDTNERTEQVQESPQQNQEEDDQRGRSPLEEAIEAVHVWDLSSHEPTKLDPELERKMLAIGLTPEEIEENKENMPALNRLFRTKIAQLLEAGRQRAPQEIQVTPDTQALIETLNKNFQELLEALGAGQRDFIESGLGRMTKDVPPSYSYKYVDEETGQEVEKTIDLSRLTSAGIMAEGMASVRQNILKGMGRLNESRADMNLHIEIIEKEDDYEVIREAVDKFVKDVELIGDLINDTEKELLDFKVKMGKLKNRTSEEGMTPDQKKKRVQELKDIVKEWAPYMRGYYTEIEGKGEDMPKNLEDLVKLARSREEGEFAAGGTKDLIDLVPIKENDGSVRYEERANLAHFYEWVRQKMWRVHDFNSTSETNFFSAEEMGVKTTFRTINFLEMIFTPSFFKQKRMQWTHKYDPKTGEPIRKLVEGSQSNDDYTKLRDALLYEVYIFQLMRNGDFVYRDNMAGIKGMTQAMQGILRTNPITKDDYLERILSMPAMSRLSLGEKDISGRTIKEKLDNNFVMGDAVRAAWSTYWYIWDFDSVAKLLGSDSVIFQKEYEQYDEEKGVKKNNKLQGKGAGYKGEDWFDENGKFKSELNNEEIEETKKTLAKRLGRRPTDEELANEIHEVIDKRKKSLMSYMNIFHGPSKDQTQIKEVRERIVQSLMQKKGISYHEAKLAEAWAFSLCRFTGVAARNDTDSVGFDQWTKQTNLEPYRQRQRSERRRAKYGSKYTMAHEDHKSGPGLKRVTLTFVEAVRDNHQRAIYELMQGGRGGNIDLERNPFKKDVDFERNYQKDEQGNYIFVDYNGGIVSQEELKDMKLSGINRVVVDEHNKVKFQIITRGENGEEIVKDANLNEHNLRPVKGDIIFRDKDGNEIEGLRGKAVSYSLDERGEPTFYDINGNEVDVGEHKARVVERDVAKIEFGYDTMKQFMANIIEQSTEWYEDIIEGRDMGLLELFKGFTSTGRPIIDTEGLNKIKDRRRKNVTYSLSTWKGTDYTKTIRTWWKDKEGGDLQIKEQSILESMFGEEVLAFIQMEVWSKTRAEDERIKKAFENSKVALKDINVFKLADYHDVLTDAQKDQLKICIWTGVFTYMLAKDIWKHRAIDSNAKRWSFDEVKEVYAVLEDSGLLNEDERPMVKENTDTGSAKMFGQEFMQALSLGNLEGFWQMIQAMIKQQSLV